MGIKKSQKLYKTFTLIEMIVVIATISLVLPALFTIIFAILQQQIKIQRLSIIKREGDNVLNLMENTIRNYSESVHSATPPNDTNKICQSKNQQEAIYFKDKFNNWFRFYLNNNNNKIASQSSIVGLIDLTSSQTKIDNFTIQCYRTSLYSPPVININFTISYNTSFLRVEENASLNYQTKVKLRSY